MNNPEPIPQIELDEFSTAMLHTIADIAADQVDWNGADVGSAYDGIRLEGINWEYATSAADAHILVSVTFDGGWKYRIFDRFVQGTFVTNDFQMATRALRQSLAVAS